MAPSVFFPSFFLLKLFCAYSSEGFSFSLIFFLARKVSIILGLFSSFYKFLQNFFCNFLSLFSVSSTLSIFNGFQFSCFISVSRDFSDFFNLYTCNFSPMQFQRFLFLYFLFSSVLYIIFDLTKLLRLVRLSVFLSRFNVFKAFRSFDTTVQCSALLLKLLTRLIESAGGGAAVYSDDGRLVTARVRRAFSAARDLQSHSAMVVVTAAAAAADRTLRKSEVATLNSSTQRRDAPWR